MEYNPNSKHSLVHLVTEYESMSRNGDSIYLEEKTYIDLVQYYELNYFYEKALEVAELALEQYQYSANLHVRRASLLLAVKRSDQAMTSLEKAEVYAPAGLDIQILRAKVLMTTKNYSEALQLVDKIKNVDKDRLHEILLLEAVIYENLKDFSKMYDILVDCLKLNPNNEEALEKIMLCIEVLRNFEDSEHLHQLLLDFDPYNYMAWYNLGNTFASTGEYPKAIEAFEFAFIINPDFEDAYLECIDMCMQIRDFNRALKFNLEFLEQFGDDEEVYARLGECYLNTGALKEAKKALKKSLKLDAYNDQVYFLLAKCQLLNEEYPQALKCIDKAMALDSNIEEYFAVKAQILYQIGDYDAADYYFRQAEEIGPEITDTWINHAIFLFRINETERALCVLEEAEFQAEGSEISYGKVACLLKMGFKSRAISELQTILQEDFSKSTFLYKIDPKLSNVNFISEMIDYYKGELI